MESELTIVSAPYWPEKFKFLTTHWHQWARVVIYLSPLKSSLDEMEKYGRDVRRIDSREEFPGLKKGRHILVMTYECFCRNKKSMDKLSPKDVLVVLDELDLSLKWAKNFRPLLKETFFELSSRPISLLAFSSHKRERIESDLQVGFNIHFLAFHRQVERVVISSPQDFFVKLWKIAKKKEVLIYCRTSLAKKCWSLGLRLLGFSGPSVISRAELFRRPEETFDSIFLASPLSAEEQSFLFSRSLALASKPRVVCYRPFAEDGKKSEFVVKSERCKQKLKDFFLTSDRLGSATLWGRFF